MPYRNLVFEQSTTTGTGNFTLSAYTGWRRCSDAFGTGSTNVFGYTIRHQAAAEYEVGIGYMSDANTLVRLTIIDSSNANAAVNFSAGTKDVMHAVNAAEVDRMVGAIGLNTYLLGLSY